MADTKDTKPDTTTSNDPSSESQSEDVDFMLSAGAEALQHSLQMFGNPASSGSPQDNEEGDKVESIPDSSEDMPSETKEKRTVNKSALNETEDKGDSDTQNETETNENDGEHVDMVLGAGAKALADSVAMFGSPDIPMATEDSNDDVTDGNAVEFLHDDEKDVTQHDDDFDIDVRIRLMTSDDETAVRSLIYDGIYVAAMNRIILNATERPFVICTIGLLAVFFTWLFGGVFLALILSVLGVPLLFYLYLRYIALAIYRRRNLPDVQTGVYKYWSATNEGRILWVAEVDSKVVGSVAIETHSAIVGEIRHLSVAPEWQCQGIGLKLAQHALSHMRRRRFKKVMTHVLSVHNEATNMCVAKFGFRKTNTRRIWCGFGEVEDYDLNLATGSRAQITEE